MAEQAAEVLNQDGLQVNAEESPAKTEEKVGEPDPQAKANEGETEHEGQKRKGGWQRKIEKLEKQRDALVERLLAKEPEKPSAQPEKPAEPKAKPEPKDFDLGDGTYDHGKYTEAVSQWNAEKAVGEYKKSVAKEESERKAKEAQGQLIQTWQQRLKTAGDTIQDLAEVLADSEAVATPLMQRAIVESDLGPQIAYELAKNPGESERISKLSPERQLVELGKLEARLAQPKSPEPEEEKEDPPAPISKAPAPVSPVARPSSTAKKTLEEMPFKEFVKEREAHLKRK